MTYEIKAAAISTDADGRSRGEDVTLVLEVFGDRTVQFIRHYTFEDAFREVKRKLEPDVIDIQMEEKDDWSGDAAVFFIVTLSDSAAAHPVLSDHTRKVSQELSTLDTGGKFQYINYRSESEQRKLKENGQ